MELWACRLRASSEVAEKTQRQYLALQGGHFVLTPKEESKVHSMWLTFPTSEFLQAPTTEGSDQKNRCPLNIKKGKIPNLLSLSPPLRLGAVTASSALKPSTELMVGRHQPQLCGPMAPNMPLTVKEPSIVVYAEIHQPHESAEVDSRRNSDQQ